MDTVLVGATSSLVASLVFLLGLSLLRPRLELSRNITRTRTDNIEVEYRYRVKIVNKSWRSAVDVSCRAYLVRERRVPSDDDGNTGVTRVKKQIELRRADGGVIPGFRRWDACAKYAHRIRFDEAAVQALDDANQAEYLILQVTARDGVSGFPRVFEREYKLAAQVKDGTFVSGRSTRIVPWENRATPVQVAAQPDTP